MLLVRLNSFKASKLGDEFELCLKSFLNRHGESILFFSLVRNEDSFSDRFRVAPLSP